MLSSQTEEDSDGYESDQISSRDDVAPLTHAFSKPTDLSAIDIYAESSESKGIQEIFYPFLTLKALITKVHLLIRGRLDPEDAFHNHLTAIHEIMGKSIDSGSQEEYVEALVTFIDSPGLRRTLDSDSDKQLNNLSQALPVALLASQARIAIASMEPDPASSEDDDIDPYDEDDHIDPYDEDAVMAALKPYIKRLTNMRGGQMLLTGIILHIMDSILLRGFNENKRCFQWLDRTALVAIRTHYLYSGQSFRQSYLPVLQWMKDQVKTNWIINWECMWNTRNFLTRVHSFDMANLLATRALADKRLPEEVVLLVRDALCSFQDVKKASQWEDRRCPWRAGDNSCECDDCDAFRDSTPHDSDREYFERVRSKQGVEEALEKMTFLGLKVLALEGSGAYFKGGEWKFDGGAKAIENADGIIASYYYHLQSQRLKRRAATARR